MSNNVQNTKKRAETIAKVKAAVDYLRDNGIKTTRQAIADECDISASALNQDYLRDFLREYGVLKTKGAQTLEEENLKLKAKIEKFEKENLRLHKVLAKKSDELEQWRQKSNGYQMKYEHLLGQYQMAFEKNHDRTFTQL